MLPVSIVIPTLDRPELLRQTVQSILDGDRLPAELIVVDQSAGPRPALPSSEQVAIRRLMLPVAGVSRARNSGVAAAGHDVLVLIDDDVRVERDWLRRLVEALLAAPERTVVTGAVAAPPSPAGFVPSTTRETQPRTYSGRVPADVLASGNMALRRRVFDEVGPFDERLGPGAAFPSAEDNDLGYRLLEAGCEITFVPGAVVYHHGIRHGRALVALDWTYGRGQGAFFAKHLSLADGHILGRFRRDAWKRARRVTRVLAPSPRRLREGIYLAGLVSGALGWWRRSARRAFTRP